MNSYLLVGTSHISSESASRIRSAMDSFKPDIVCVELDMQRYHGLQSDAKPSYSPQMIFKVGLIGYVFVVIGGFVQQKLGKLVGVTPGHDMLTAVVEAKNRKLRVALIDQPIDITLKRLSRHFSKREIWRAFVDAVRSLVFPSKFAREIGMSRFDLASVPDQKTVDKLVLYMKKRYPSLHSVLLEERNSFMVRKIVTLHAHYPDAKILVVVGAAHVGGMEELLRNHYKFQAQLSGHV